MIDNQEKVHTQLHKFDKIVCNNINEINVKQLYQHFINMQHKSGIEEVSLSIINNSSEAFTMQTLRDYLVSNGFIYTKRGYPASGTYGKGSTMNVIDYINCQSTGLNIGGYYFAFTITSDNTLSVEHRTQQESLSADYFYNFYDTIVQLQ